MMLPKNDFPEWQYIYTDLLERAEFGDIITYEQLDYCLGRPFRDNRTPIYRAMAELRARRFRHLDCIFNVGYRVVEAREHIGQATEREKRSRRMMGKALDILVHTPVEELSTEERRRHDEKLIVVSRKNQYLRAKDARVQKEDTMLRNLGLRR